MSIIGRTTSTPERLTTRQQEVLELLRRGDTNEEIARSLGISLDGAKWHVSEIIGRLGVSDRYEAARWRPEGERRPWWTLVWLRDLRWSTTAKATSLAGLAVVTMAVIALAWGVWRTNDDRTSIVLGPRTMIVSVGGGAIAVDTETGGVVPRFRSRDLADFISPDGIRSVYPCGEDALAYADRRVTALCIWDPTAAPTVVVSSSDLPPDRFVWDESLGTQIAWSADARKIAFLVYQRTAPDVVSSGDVYMKDLASGDLRLLDRGEFEHYRGFLSWSPDAAHVSMIDFVTPIERTNGSKVPGRADLRLIDVASGQRNDVSASLSTEGEVERYAWSSDSRSIAFTRDEGKQSLYVVDVTATAINPQRIGDAWESHDLVWSPDGAWIAASELVDDRAHVFVTRADGSERRSIDGGMTSSSHPAWSPDGRYIAFAGAPSDTSGDLHIYVASTSGGTPREVADASPLESRGIIIAWSADGERVLYTAQAGACHSFNCPPGYLRMVDADGSGAARQLYDLPASEILGWTD